MRLKTEETISKPKQKRSNGWKATRNQSQYDCGKSRVTVAEMSHSHKGACIFLSVSRPAVPGQNVRQGKVVPSAMTFRKRGTIKTTMLLRAESALALYDALRAVIESARGDD